MRQQIEKQNATRALLFAAPAMIWITVLFLVPLAFIVGVSFFTNGSYGEVERPLTLGRRRQLRQCDVRAAEAAGDEVRERHLHDVDAIEAEPPRQCGREPGFDTRTRRTALPEPRGRQERRRHGQHAGLCRLECRPRRALSAGAGRDRQHGGAHRRCE